MTYKETLEYLFSRLPLFSHIGQAAYKTDITNTVLLCAAIGDPQNKIKTIHVAGTNGKGSTSHMLAAIFQQSGFKTGLYTSPHLKDFRERIKINGDPISEEFVTSFVEKIRETSEKLTPSFFEVTVAMAFDYFNNEEVDIAIIETGLGGRLDSTNIIKPELSVITNIGYDHMNILGNTLQQIAFEKAGIIKKNTPVVIGEFIEETEQVFLNKALECDAPIIFAEETFAILNAELKDTYLEVELKDNYSDKKFLYRTDLTGLYQQRNIRTVISAIQQLINIGFDLRQENIISGLLNVKELTGLHGRWEVIAKDPIIVLDVAHNEDGIKMLLSQVNTYHYEKLHIVFGVVKDKDVSKILSLLPKDAYFYFTNAKIPRALPASDLNEKAKFFQLNGDAFEDVNLALKNAMSNAGKKDFIIVCGSVFVVAEVALDEIAKEIAKKAN